MAQYEDELLFSTVVQTLALAVNGVRSSVHAAYLANQEDFSVGVRSLYDKLQGVEPQVSRALVRESSERLAPVIKALRGTAFPASGLSHQDPRWQSPGRDGASHRRNACAE